MSVSPWKGFLGAVLLSLLIFFATAAPAHAQGTARFAIGSRQWYAGTRQETMDVAPFILRDRTYLPVRYLAEALGIDPGGISWQSNDHTVTLASGNTTVQLTAGKSTAYVDDRPLTMDVAPVLLPPGRVMLPARAVAQAFGWQVGWRQADKSVVIYPQEVAVAASGVRVRKEPSTTAPLLTVLARGTRLAVTGESDTWFEVGLPAGGTGWIAGYLVDKTTPPAPAVDSTLPSRGGAVTPAQTPVPAGGPSLRVSLGGGFAQAAFSLNSAGTLYDAGSDRILTVLSPGRTYAVTASPGGLQIGGVTLPAAGRDILVRAAQTPSASSFLISVQAGGALHRYRGGLVLQSAGNQIAVYNQLPLEQYLYGVVPLEMSPAAPPAALEAQAVAARTYTLAHLETVSGQTYDLLDPGVSQDYGGYDAEQPAADRAVDLTQGQILVSGGQPADTVYCASDGGYTENSEDVWSKTVPYLRGKVDPYDPTGKSGWHVTYSTAQLVQRLAAAGYPFGSVSSLTPAARTSCGHRIKALTVVGVGKDGRPQNVTIANADNVRIALDLPSAPFTMTAAFAPSPRGAALTAVTFTGAGEGHTVGLSQEGAEAMARDGLSCQAICAFYYTGLSLVPDYGR